MAKFIITRAGQPPREVAIAHERVTIGRHPYNDIVLAHSAVSGEHAVVSLLGGAAVLDDLRSTNGTFVNGQRIERQLLADGDQVAVAKFTLQFVATPPPAPAPTPAAPRVATVEVLNGANLGRKLTLAKAVTTLGSPGVLVVVIAREGDGFVLRHVDGASIPLLNGQPLAGGTSPLADGDMLELTGTRMVFRLTT
jgi:pSer/pThr/pTyr-binding forkhead associated (FHA) protein